MKSIGRIKGLTVGAMLMLAGCGSLGGERDGGPTASPTPTHPANGVNDTPVKVGDPYTIDGTTYTPADIVDYDDVGYASWYGEELAGRPTANGEKFDPAGISAAHKTLPLPSYVEVTALDTGRTILVRVNDRGPMVGDRLIDLSRGAADQLGISSGVAGVRVRRTNPPAAERVQLRAGKPVPERIETPDSLLAILRTRLKAMPAPKGLVATPPTETAPAAPIEAAPAAPIASGQAKPGDDRMAVKGSATPKPAAKPAPVARPAASDAGQYVVQVGAFSSESRAAAAAKSVDGIVSKAGNLWRVRIGPFATAADASGSLAKAKAKGFRDAVVQRAR